MQIRNKYITAIEDWQEKKKEKWYNFTVIFKIKKNTKELPENKNTASRYFTA